jgi:hypothetical protein
MLHHFDSPSAADADLYLRGTETLLACWEENARGATGAAVQRFRGIMVAVFPNEPERGLQQRGPGTRPRGRERADALEAMSAAYAPVGVTRFAAWVHESDQAMRGDLEGRLPSRGVDARDGHGARRRLPAPAGDRPRALDWSEYLRIIGVPPDFLFGIYNVGTLGHARRRGLGTALAHPPLTQLSLIATILSGREYGTPTSCLE